MRAFKPMWPKKRRSSSRPPYEVSCSRPNSMAKSRLITRRNRATVNRIRGAFRVFWSHVAVHSGRRAGGPFSSINLPKSLRNYFASGLTLDNEEFHELLDFLEENYEPFRQGVRKYIPLDKRFDERGAEYLRTIFSDPDKNGVLRFIANNRILPDDVVSGLQHLSRQRAGEEFENMLGRNLL